MAFCKDKTKLWRKFVRQQRPYRYFMTLTFGQDIGVRIISEFSKKLLKEFNKMVFGRDYKKRERHLQGFAFIEEHPLGTSRCENHVHILVKSDERYKALKRVGVKDVFIKAALRVKNAWGRCPFNENGIDIRPVGSLKKRTKYCFKTINDRNLDRVKPITKHGFADSLDVY